MGINLKEVHANTTAEEWSERYDEMFCNSQLLILELAQENKSLKRQRIVGLALATATAILSTGVLLKKRGND